MEKIDLSVIILNYNTKDLLKKCLRSVFRAVEKLNKKVEVIVVDNASSDGSVEMVRSVIGERLSVNGKGILITDPRSLVTIKLIENKNNLGFSAGNNLGLKEAGGNYVLFLNPDTEVYPNSLNETMGYMDSHREVGALTVKTMLVSGGMDPDCHRGFPTPWASISYFLGFEKLFPESRLFGQYHKCYLNLNENHEIDAGAGAFMVVRKEVIDKVGGWDEKYFFYGEDLDFFYRIKKAGYKAMFYAKPLVLHHKGGSSGIRKESKDITQATKATKLKVAKESIKAMEIFYKKFYKDLYPSWLTFLVLGGIRVKGWFRYLKFYFQHENRN